MSCKPADLFFGVMEFFAILMPGALLAFLLPDWDGALFGVLLPSLPGTAASWIAFVVASYVLWHFLHHLGFMPDTWVYDELYVKRWRPRKGEEGLLTKARGLMAENPRSDPTMTSVSSWAGSYVRLHSDVAAGELERGGADSKFFRSLSIVVVVAMALLTLGRHALAFFGAFALLGFSLWTFCDRRWRNYQLTYERFIMLIMDEADNQNGKT